MKSIVQALTDASDELARVASALEEQNRILSEILARLEEKE